jgi:hypothetical protein
LKNCNFKRPYFEKLGYAGGHFFVGMCSRNFTDFLTPAGAPPTILVSDFSRPQVHVLPKTNSKKMTTLTKSHFYFRLKKKGYINKALVFIFFPETGEPEKHVTL